MAASPAARDPRGEVVAQAHVAVAHALTLDERGQYTAALAAYRAALTAVLRALSVCDHAVAAGDHAARTDADTMRSRLDRVRDRLVQLEKASNAAAAASAASSTVSATPTALAAAAALRIAARPLASRAGPRIQQQHHPHVQRPAHLPVGRYQAEQAYPGSHNVVPGPAGAASIPQAQQQPQGHGVDPALVATIEAEILDRSPGVSFEDITGMDDVKLALHEMIVLPVQRPDLYTGLRSPGKGILLFGPPGTGKTMAAKAVASSSNATFFSISASTLNSKYHGESEKLVRALFQVARNRQPSFIFIDEIDSMLGSRGEGEHEASRRLKTEFLVQFDGAAGSKDDAVYIVGATNRPQDLDDAVRRRLNKRIYVPLPDFKGRYTLLKKLTVDGSKEVRWNVSDRDLQRVANNIEFYSGADIHALCREAALMPLRELGPSVAQVPANKVRPVSSADLEAARQTVKASASRTQLIELDKWDREFGSTRRPPVNPSNSDVPGGAGRGTGPTLRKKKSSQGRDPGRINNGEGGLHRFWK